MVIDYHNDYRLSEQHLQYSKAIYVFVLAQKKIDKPEKLAALPGLSLYFA